MSKNNTGAFVGGVLLGTAVGAIAGLLLPPRTRKQMRRMVKQSVDALPDLAEDVSENWQRQTDRVSKSALRHWDDTVTRLQSAIAAGIDAARQDETRPNTAEIEVSEAEADSPPSYSSPLKEQ
jgi:gas vesicle protein